MSSSIANNPQSSLELLESLKTQLWEGTPKQQLPILHQLWAAGAPGYQVLMDFLRSVSATLQPTVSLGRSLQLLQRVDDPVVQSFLTEHFPRGAVPLPPDCQVDYSAIQTALLKEDFEQADRLTLQKMCELAGPAAVQRKWLYFTEVRIFPVIDLQTLDLLWWVYSEGKFGFTQQREIWQGVGKNWDKLWPKIAWKEGNIWTRYPGGFVWTLEAPVGHLPLTNQLRGVRVMDALMNHPAWETT